MRSTDTAQVCVWGWPKNLPQLSRRTLVRSGSQGYEASLSKQQTTKNMLEPAMLHNAKWLSLIIPTFQQPAPNAYIGSPTPPCPSTAQPKICWNQVKHSNSYASSESGLLPQTGSIIPSHMLFRTVLCHPTFGSGFPSPYHPLI